MTLGLGADHASRRFGVKCMQSLTRRSSMKMIPTYVFHLPSGIASTGEFLAIDLGGRLAPLFFIHA